MDYSKRFTVEFYGAKGWEISSCWTSWKDASNQAEKVALEGYQVRVTSPDLEDRSELQQKLELIQNRYDRDNISAEEYADLIVEAVTGGK